MRLSKILLPTLKEVPSEAETISHKLMLRAGLVRKLVTGVYSYLPLGFKVLQKIKTIVRKEMDKIGGQEILMPAIHPLSLWEESGRWDLFSPVMYRLLDYRGEGNTLLGATHEVVITDLVKREIQSYRQLPKLLYQIQTKFRNELRPRFGLIRCREFIMMDAYSFHATQKSLEETYKSVYEAHKRIFDRCGLNYKIVEADSGPFGGGISHEYTVLSDSGEDRILICEACGYAANVEKLETQKDTTTSNEENPPFLPLEKVETPNMKTVEEVSNFLKVKPEKLIKTLVYQNGQEKILVLIRGDDELNEVKLKNYLKSPKWILANEEMIKEVTNTPCGFAGPIGLKGVKIIGDWRIKGIHNAVTGANLENYHLINVNPDRDFKVAEYLDLRKVKEGEPCPKCGDRLILKSGIEIDHIFNLGTTYSKALGANFLNEKGVEKPLLMGCYGIGISRIISAVIEQNYDNDGIIWPFSIAPYEVLILAVNYYDEKVKYVADRLYKELVDLGIEVLLDDRDETPGVKFKDADLIGIPLKVTIGKKGLLENKVEIKLRNSSKVEKEDIKEVKNKILSLISSFVAHDV